MDEYTLHLTKPEWLKVEQELDDAQYLQTPDGRVIQSNDQEVIDILMGNKPKKKR